jgi:lysozyme
VQLVAGDLPPVLDVEKAPEDQSPEEFKESVLTWLRLVEEHYGIKPIIYTYYKFKKQYLSDPVFDQYPYWIAHYYVDKVEYQGPWRFWQHTDVGRLPGINGYVDLNIYNGSYYDLCKLTIGSDKDTTDVAGVGTADENRPMDASKLPNLGRKNDMQPDEEDENAPLPIKD